MGLHPETSMALKQLLVPSARQTNWPNRALTSMCMEVTYVCRLLGLFLSPCFGRFCSHVAVVLASEPLPESFQLGCFVFLQGGFGFVRGGLDTPKINKKSVDL